MKAKGAGVNAVLEFEDIRLKKGVHYVSLDFWFVGLAKQTPRVDTMLATKEQHDAWMKERVYVEMNMKVRGSSGHMGMPKV